MGYLSLCAIVFLAAYLLNILYITVFYHRALTHQALRLRPWLRWLVVHTGNWVTGLDPKAWACMHRLHHQYSDTPRDPHSPVFNGIWKVLPAQLYSYNKALAALTFNRPSYASVVRDLDFPINWLNRKQLWYLPYVFHAVVALFIGAFFQAWLLAACYWFGMMSHPIQGWMVNAFGHSYGYRNFDTPDKSVNNTIVAWLVFGEGFQNNHHHAPNSPKFSAKWWEIDMGYGLCKMLSLLGIIQLRPPSSNLTEEEEPLPHPA